MFGSAARRSAGNLDAASADDEISVAMYAEYGTSIVEHLVDAGVLVEAVPS